ncbi:DUF58 domain-containing protein [Limnoglobus roseus]|uniref:DUF58 domain-containing protein n=1 Tax=Limnoglobus roseus TaxID=2598579 RepID=A0A5C1A8C7_9BACT|nr:DUF58 domain-containing protein [Limnoglobus roseus]QEL14022.1 hypothetical protein PX52LOC_00884 [Limnoglobus roseus]
MAADSDDPKRFFDPRVIARISTLDLRAKYAVSGFISGHHKSPFFGQSTTFVQHREYMPGDDIRHVDWKVWSRTDRFMLKQFEAETNLRCTLVVDTSESMIYGRGPMNKYEYACTAAACLAYMTVKQQDAVGLVSYGWDVNQALPARSSQNHIDAVAKTLNLSKPKEKTDILKAIRKIAEQTPSRGLIVLFSDLLTDREPLFKGLEMLRHRRHDVMVFHVLDDDELTFPFGGMTRFEGMEDLPNLMCDPKALRDGYLEVLEEYLQEVRRGCSRMGVDYALVRTSDYLDAILSRFLYQRMSSKGSPARR